MKHSKSHMFLWVTFAVIVIFFSTRSPGRAEDLQESLMPDQSFGKGGAITTDIFEDAVDTGGAMALQEDGKIIMAGSSISYEPGSGCDPSAIVRSAAAIVRYMPDGSLDTAFGEDGKAITGFGTDLIHVSDVAVQADGKILVCGSGTNFTTTAGFFFIRYNQDGTLDTDFGNDGMAAKDIAVNLSNPRKIIIQPDGKIILFGIGVKQPLFVLARFNADGTLDNSYANDGMAKVDNPLSTDLQNATAAVDHMGRIVTLASDRTGYLLLSRFYSSGRRDFLFGTAGLVKIKIPLRVCRGQVVMAVSAGRIVIASACELNEDIAQDYQNSQFWDLFLARLNASGKLDKTFGSAGTVISDFGRLEVASNIFCAPLGKIVVAMEADKIAEDPPSEFILARFDAKGRLDAAFGEKGMVRTNYLAAYPFILADQPIFTQLQNNDKVLIGGTTGDSKFALERHLLK